MLSIQVCFVLDCSSADTVISNDGPFLHKFNNIKRKARHDGNLINAMRLVIHKSLPDRINTWYNVLYWYVVNLPGQHKTYPILQRSCSIRSANMIEVRLFIITREYMRTWCSAGKQHPVAYHEYMYLEPTRSAVDRTDIRLLKWEIR